jgi:membrane-associated protease RseP (regulator of RpoE activity)
VAPARRPPSAWKRWGRNLALFVLTVLSVFLVGGPWLVLGLMSIMLAHEFGHYFACLYYGIDATLPFFIPFPVSLVGTLGAFIRIRAPFPHRRALFDVGIAGPLAGFVVTLPVLMFGLLEASWMPESQATGGLMLGEPLLFRWLSRLFLGPAPEGMTLVLGPLGLAAWFGLFLTALNLIPIGQLDGGHVTYALLRRGAHSLSRVAFLVCMALVYFGPSWLVWSILLLVLGRTHPATLDDYEPVGDGRVVVGLVGLVVLAICFVPDPIQGSWPTLLAALREALRGFTSR